MSSGPRIHAPNQQEGTIPGGNPCPGTTLRISPLQQIVVRTQTIPSGNGSGNLNTSVSGGACGRWVQLVTPACRTSNAAQIP